VQLPQGLSLFNNILATTPTGMSLLTGALPAVRPADAGIVGIYEVRGRSGGEASMTVGSARLHSGFLYGGRAGRSKLFAAGRFTLAASVWDRPSERDPSMTRPIGVTGQDHRHRRREPRGCFFISGGEAPSDPNV
jgi:hypothetical protein